MIIRLALILKLRQPNLALLWAIAIETDNISPDGLVVL